MTWVATRSVSIAKAFVSQGSDWLGHRQCIEPKYTYQPVGMLSNAILDWKAGLPLRAKKDRLAAVFSDMQILASASCRPSSNCPCRCRRDAGLGLRTAPHQALPRPLP